MDESKNSSVKSIIGFFYLQYIFICMFSVYALIVSFDNWLKPFPIGSVSIPACVIPFGVLFFMSGMVIFEFKTKKVTKLFESIFESDKTEVIVSTK